MKSLLYFLLASLLVAPAGDDVYQNYIRQYSPIAVAEMQRTGVPASITLAQGLLESAAGQSVLAIKANNHFGVKCHSDWTGKKMYRDDDAAQECFRVYPDAEASFRDHSDFLRYRDRYKGLFELEPTDYKAWARGLKKAGYATDPRYADKLIKIINDYKLYTYDAGTEVPEETPLVAESPVKITPSKVHEEYRFNLERAVYEINGVPCIYAVEGDEYETLAAANNLFLKELLSFNDLKASEPLVPGTVVFLKSKKSQAARGVEKYVIGSDGETLRGIAQRFGVRVSAIRRLNKLPADYVPKEGDTIQLRRK